MAGSTEPPASQDEPRAAGASELYPPLRQLPRLGVAYADRYRQVRVQETLFELLTQQYEMARIEEAKDVPAISVIDAPGSAEKKSFPHRLWVTLALTFIVFACTSFWIIGRSQWDLLRDDDPRKELAGEMWAVFRRRLRSLKRITRRQV